MAEHFVSYRRAKAVSGAIVLAAVVAAAVWTGVPRPKEPLPKGELEARISALPGFAGVLALRFDGVEYSGQEAARTVAADVLVRAGAARETLALSMKAAGDLVRERINVYQKLVVTGYRRPVDFEEGLAFASRALWLAAELAAPCEGWSVLRLPDMPREAARALEGIYANPAVSGAQGGVVVATVDLETERRARPAADVNEILAAPLVPCVDHDSAFDRSPALRTLDVTILSGRRKVARFAMTREAYEATDLSGLLAELSRTVLRISAKELAIAEKYSNTELYTPLLFDRIVKEEDKAEIRAQEAARREAETSFYGALFSKGRWENFEAPTAQAETRSTGQSD